jgi:hypothetical protein
MKPPVGTLRRAVDRLVEWPGVEKVSRGESAGLGT